MRTWTQSVQPRRRPGEDPQHEPQQQHHLGRWLLPGGQTPTTSPRALGCSTVRSGGTAMKLSPKKASVQGVVLHLLGLLQPPAASVHPSGSCREEQMPAKDRSPWIAVPMTLVRASATPWEALRWDISRAMRATPSGRGPAPSSFLSRAGPASARLLGPTLLQTHTTHVCLLLGVGPGSQPPAALSSLTCLAVLDDSVLILRIAFSLEAALTGLNPIDLAAPWYVASAGLDW